ncbi:MAG: hypothetical protein MJ094_00685 [Saccharofermentans sp.]|nr:hypothetical protein [Saccharofermentans sp.]
MRIKKLTAIILTCVLLLSGCSSKTEDSTLDYQETIAVITAYEDAYRDYVQTGDGQVSVTTSISETPNGQPCNARFTSVVNQPFTSCSLEVQRNDRTEYDEYFNISDTMMMAVRTYITESGVPVITKYISTMGQFYLLNPDTQTCDLVENIESLDFFMTFEQVTTAYAGT